MSEKDNVYTISGTCTLKDLSMNLNGMEMVVDGTAEYLIRFTENSLLEYSLSSDLEFVMELPDILFEMEGTGSFSVAMKNLTLDHIVLTETFDSNKMVTDFSEYGEIDTIYNASTSATFHIDGYEYSTHNFDFAEGFTLADVNSLYDAINYEDITWYSDENCTVPVSGTITGKSFESLNLYAKNVAIPAGYAVVISEYESFNSYEYFDLEYFDTYELSNSDYFDVYLTIDNGTRTLFIGDEISLEEGKTYKIEFISPYTED